MYFGVRATFATAFTAIFLISIPVPVRCQEVRGDAGIPSYVKSPSDRPPPPSFNPSIASSNQTSDDILAAIPEKDSVIVVRGKLNMRGKDYLSAYPVLRAGSLDDELDACRKEYVMSPQYKATAQEGFTMFVIVKDTGADPKCWKQFRHLETVSLSCDLIMVKPSKDEESVAWDNPDSSYANSFDLRTYSLGPVQPK